MSVSTVMTSHLFKSTGHISLHLLDGILSSLILVNQFVLGISEFLREFLHAAFKLVEQDR